MSKRRRQGRGRLQREHKFIATHMGFYKKYHIECNVLHPVKRQIYLLVFERDYNLLRFMYFLPQYHKRIFQKFQSFKSLITLP